KLWPLESCVSSGVVVAMGEKKIAGGAEGLRGVGRHAVLNFSPFKWHMLISAAICRPRSVVCQIDSLGSFCCRFFLCATTLAETGDTLKRCPDFLVFGWKPRPLWPGMNGLVKSSALALVVVFIHN